MTDIRTVEEITIGDDYRVRAAEVSDGVFEAVVIAERKLAAGDVLDRDGGWRRTVIQSEEADAKWLTVPDAPIVKSKGRYGAAGRAVDKYRTPSGGGDEP